METMKTIWVYAESDEARARMCAGAKEIGETVSCVYAGSAGDLEKIASQGADTVLYLGDVGKDRHIGDYAYSLADAVETKAPDLVLFEKTQNGRLLAAKVATRQKCAALTNIVAIRTEGEVLEVDQMVFGGTAIRTVRPRQASVFAVVPSQLFDDKKVSSAAPVESLEFVAPQQTLLCREVKEKPANKVDLLNAKRIVCIGRGVADASDLEMISEFAGYIGAEMACMRPVSEVYGFMETERYVGVTGVMLAPELLVSIGVSGQIQHMVGCNQAGHIIAINKDKAARIFSQSDFGLVADYKRVIPQIIEGLAQ